MLFTSRFKYRWAEPADAVAVHDVMLEAARSIPSDQFEVDELEFVRSHVEDQGRILLAEAGGTLAGVQIIRLPGDAEDNLGYDCGLEDDQLDSVAHAETSAVRLRFFGHGLQRSMLRQCVVWAKANGYSWLCATVHPENRISLKNLRRVGFKVITTKQKYGGHPRHIMAMRL